MTDVTCVEAKDAAVEYALGILPSEDRSRIAAHILRCRECRAEVEDLSRVGEDLLELIPAAEPPLGFDRRVLAAVQPKRRRRGLVVAAASAAAAAAAVIGLLVSQGGVKAPHDHLATLTADGQAIGSVYTEGHPAWVSMMVRHAAVSGPVTCELIQSNGTVVQLGSFDLVGGSGSWAAPEPVGIGSIAGARLIAADGHVVATAAFRT
jgi:anti-sigma-K factor RskA